jgi:hypothetical protein
MENDVAVVQVVKPRDDVRDDGIPEATSSIRPTVLQSLAAFFYGNRFFLRKVGNLDVSWRDEIRKFSVFIFLFSKTHF